MPYLITDREQFELQPGPNALGGSAADAVRFAELARLPHVGSIIVSDDAPPVVQRLSSRVPLKVDGVMLGGAPMPVHEGATIQVGGVWMTYRATAEAADGAEPGGAARRRQSEVATQVLQAIAAPSRPTALVALATGQLVKVGERDVVIGRSEDSDVVLAGEQVSRRHAVIRAAGGGHVITDESTNGTLVNGVRLTAPHVLHPGDVLAFGGEQYRYDFLDAATGPARGDGAAPSPAAAVAPAGAPLAELETIRGSAGRTTYPIRRPVCAVGRGAHNDVCIPHESVSASHATLLLKGDTWYLTDLRSTSGTYVDGYRVAGERALPAGCTVRMGRVELVFRPLGGAGRPERGSGARRGIFRRLVRALSLGG